MMQLLKLLEFREPMIMASVRDSHFDADFQFTSEEGLMIAFGITAYDDNEEPIEDPQYGHLKAYYKSWGLEEGHGVHFRELPTETCSRAELGLPEEEDGSSASKTEKRFFEVHSSSANDYEYYYKKLKCIQVDKLVL